MAGHSTGQVALLALAVALMKVGQVFDLPPEHSLPPGHIGKLENKDRTKLLAKYEVVEIEGELKGRVIVTYGNKRRKV